MKADPFAYIIIGALVGIALALIRTLVLDRKKS